LQPSVLPSLGPSVQPSQSPSMAPSMQGWTQVGADIEGEAADDKAGCSVSFSAWGNSVAIGAIDNDGAGSNSGHVRVYDWDGMSWVQRGADIDGQAANDLSGVSVVLSGDGMTLAVGASQIAIGSGYTRVFFWDGSSWKQRGADIDGAFDGDKSGDAIAISVDGHVVAIGAPNNDGLNGVDSGHVRVYEWDGAAWTQRGEDIDGEAASDLSGSSVSLSSNGSILAIGAKWNDGNGANSGHVRVYQWTGNSWIQRGEDIDGEAAGDGSGAEIVLSFDGMTLAIGARFNSGNGFNSGHVRVYEWSGTAWTQRGLDIDGEAAGDQAASSVAMSSDGNTVAVGAVYNDVGGTNSGHVRVYFWDGLVWSQRGADIDGKAAGDSFGSSVAMSADGYRLAVGAFLADGTAGVDSGSVRVFSFPVP